MIKNKYFGLISINLIVNCYTVILVKKMAKVSAAGIDLGLSGYKLGVILASNRELRDSRIAGHVTSLAFFKVISLENILLLKHITSLVTTYYPTEYESNKNSERYRFAVSIKV